jgi:hypothetical protein
MAVRKENCSDGHRGRKPIGVGGELVTQKLEKTQKEKEKED